MSDFKKLIEAAVEVQTKASGKDEQVNEINTSRVARIDQLKIWDSVKEFEKKRGAELTRKYKGKKVLGYFVSNTKPYAKAEELILTVDRVEFMVADQDGMPYVVFSGKTEDGKRVDVSLSDRTDSISILKESGSMQTEVQLGNNPLNEAIKDPAKKIAKLIRQNEKLADNAYAKVVKALETKLRKDFVGREIVTSGGIEKVKSIQVQTTSTEIVVYLETNEDEYEITSTFY